MWAKRDGLVVALASSVVMVAGGTATASAASVWLAHDMTFSFQQADFSTGLRPHKNIVQFLGNAFVGVTETPSSGGVVTNPVYEDKGVKGTNPLYGEPEHLRSAEQQLEVADFIAITLEPVVTSWAVLASGIVHRDLACRNVLLSTRLGDYSSVAGSELLFSSEGAFDAFASKEKPPIRWSAPEVLRLYRNGDAGSSDWIDIESGSTLSTIVIPGPSSLALIGLCCMVGARRRR